ncbi:MAG TPA: MarR family transcriptional regulator [Candidatus Cybelea sp.]|jgi:DNA-binding MarR family transcriptional regulator
MAPSKGRRKVADRLHSAAIYVLRQARAADRKSPLGPAQLSALSVLVYGGSRTPGELADTEQVTPPTMTRVVGALRRGGYVRLRSCPSDARSTIVEASRKGVAALQKARAARLDLIEELLAGSSEADLTRLGDAIEALLA